MKRKFLLTALSVLLAVAMLFGSMPAVSAYDIESASPAFHITVTASPEAAIGGYFSLNRIPPGNPPVTNRDNHTEQTYAIKAGTDYRIYDVQPSINGLYFTCFIIDYPECLNRNDETYHCSDIYLEAPASDFRVILVYSPNHPPVAVSDNYSVDEDAILSVAAPGVSGNDTDAEGSTLTASKVSGPSHGSVTLNADGSFTYTPNANYNGTDTFTYKVNDGTADSNVATVTINVTPVNDAPVVADIPDQAIIEGSTFTNIILDDYVSDADNSDPEISWTCFGNTNLTVVITDRVASIAIPNADWHGTETLTFNATDPEGSSDSDPAVFTVTLLEDDAPVANADAYSTDEDTQLVVGKPGILSNDTDTDNDPISAILVNDVKSGMLDLETDGSFTYTPNADYNGTDSFTYKVSDGTVDSGVATVTINVTPVNDAPSFIKGADQTVDEDAGVQTVTGWATSLSAGPANEASQTLAFNITGNTNAALFAVAPVVDSTGTLTCTPAANANGSATVTLVLTDNGGTANGGVDTSASQSFVITVNPIDDDPVANDQIGDQSVTTDEDTPVAITLVASDAEGDPLAYTVGTPSHGTLTGTAPALTYEPGFNYNGSDSFTFSVNDGSNESNAATVSITVNPVNDAPVAVDDSYNTAEDTLLSVNAPGVLSNDTDVENDSLTAALVAGPANGVLVLSADGSFSYTPNADFNGTDYFTYQANDGVADSTPATVRIYVGSGSDLPVANPQFVTTDEDTPKSITLTGSDADGDSLSYHIVNSPSHGELEGDAPNLTYKPALNYNGSDSFTFKVNDGESDSVPAKVDITINPVNDPPVAVDDEDSGDSEVYTTLEDTQRTVAAPGVLTNDTDADGNPLTAVKVADPAHGSVTLNADGSFTYTPNADFNGTDSFTYKVSDGTVDSGVATVTINVTPVNDAPSFVKGADQTVDEDAGAQTVSEWATSLSVGPADESTQILTFHVVDNADAGFFTVRPAVDYAGTLTYTPAANVNGSVLVTLTLSDNGGTANEGIDTSAARSFVITVNPVDDTPIANINGKADVYSTDEDTPLTIDAASGVLANDSDADGNPLTAVKIGDPIHGSLELKDDGSFTYTPNANYNGNDTFIYQATDGKYSSSLATVYITVDAVNDAPEADGKSATVRQDRTVEITLSAADIDSEALTYDIVGHSSNVEHITLNNNTVTYDPENTFHGTDTFTYRAYDGSLYSEPATVTVTVDKKPSSWSGDDDPVIKPTPTPDDGTNIEGDINGEGRFLRTIVYWSPDKVCMLVVSVDTVGLDSELSPLKDIAILFKEGEIDPPVGMKALSLNYDFTPNGATLDPAGLLVFKYDDTLLPPGYPEDRLRLYYYDKATQGWIGLANAQLDPVNNQFVYNLKTFGVMAIFYPYTLPEDSTDITGPATTPAPNLPVIAVSPTPKDPLPTTPSNNWWWIIAIVIAALAVAGLLFYMIRKNKATA